MSYLLIFLLTLPVAHAQDFVWTPEQRRVYADLQKLKIQPLHPLSNDGTAPGVRIFLDDYADMLALVTSDDDRLFEQFIDRENDRLDQLKKMDDTSPWQRVLQAEVRLHWAFVKLKFGREVSASWDVIRAYKLLSENQKRFPHFLPTYKSLGTLHVMIGSVPEQYTWVAGLLGLSGTVRQGQQELQQAQPDTLFGLEARLIDLMIRAYVLKFTDADGQNLQRLIRENGNNLLVHLFGATIEQKNGHSEQALAYLTARPTGVYQPLPVVNNILGDIYLRKGQYATAEGYYAQFLRTYKGRNFLKDSYYKLFLCGWLSNKPDARTRPFLDKVISVGRTTVESDKAAQKFAEAYLKRGVPLNQKVLMRARLASDGGFTDSAMAYLRPYHEARFATVAERAEYNYRLGRIHQRRNDSNAAIPCLSRALALSETDQLSFGATAALQLGYIYQGKNDRPKAKSFFEKALSFKHHEYKNSVDNKARAGLNGL